MIAVGIRGAGVAGLSLARALLKHIPGINVSVFDRRPRLPHPNRTFGVFCVDRSFLPVTPLFSWDRIVLRSPNFRRTLACPYMPYSLIRGQDFFEAMLRELETTGVSCTWECRTVEVSHNSITVDSTPKRFDLVIDAAFDATESSATLWQSFAGLWVRSEKPAFDPSAALLMDLDVRDSHAPVRFVYLLPTSETSALIEHTVFAKEAFSQEQHISDCLEWAYRNGYNEFTIDETECGRIPMGLAKLPGSANSVMRIGTRGGALRASTGYAFQATQLQVNTLACQIAATLNGGTSMPKIAPSPLPAWTRFSDSLFVRALANSSSQNGQFIMGKLLQNAPDHDMIAFLAGNASLAQALRVMMCVPKLAMLKALIGWG